MKKLSGVFVVLLLAAVLMPAGAHGDFEVSGSLKDGWPAYSTMLDKHLQDPGVLWSKTGYPFTHAGDDWSTRQYCIGMSEPAFGDLGGMASAIRSMITGKMDSPDRPRAGFFLPPPEGKETTHYASPYAYDWNASAPSWAWTTHTAPVFGRGFDFFFGPAMPFWWVAWNHPWVVGLPYMGHYPFDEKGHRNRLHHRIDDVVPIPPAIWFLGLGMIGLIGIKRARLYFRT